MLGGRGTADFTGAAEAAGRSPLAARIFDVGEVAQRLGIPPATVKTRHLRARRRLQRLLGRGLGGALRGNFPFDRVLCERPASPSLLPSDGFGAQEIRA